MDRVLFWCACAFSSTFACQPLVAAHIAEAGVQSVPSTTLKPITIALADGSPQVQYVIGSPKLPVHWTVTGTAGSAPAPANVTVDTDPKVGTFAHQTCNLTADKVSLDCTADFVLNSNLTSAQTIPSALHIKYSGSGAYSPADQAFDLTVVSQSAAAAANITNPPQSDTRVHVLFGIGGFDAFTQNATDYQTSANVLETTHLGNTTPQYLLGVDYELPFNWDRKSFCESSSKLLTLNTDIQRKPNYEDYVRCRPVGVFISPKFSTDTSNGINGFTFGLTHKLQRWVAVLAGFSLTPVSQPSPGFIAAAVQTVQQQQKLNNPFYERFNTGLLQNNSPNAFDGFPTYLESYDSSSNTYSQGALIYQGSPVVTRYHGGLLLGFAVTDLGALLHPSGK